MCNIDFSRNFKFYEDILSAPSSPKKDEQSAQTDECSRDAQNELIKLIADIGTGIWRIHQGRSGVKGDPQRELNSILRTVESICDAMAGRGIEIEDHTGKIITDGEALRIIAYQPSRDLTRFTVIETLRPTIYFKGKIMQMGEVIVGKPETEITSED